jgi:hypothetical protein
VGLTGKDLAASAEQEQRRKLLEWLPIVKLGATPFLI